jgi:hypothetical protein
VGPWAACIEVAGTEAVGAEVADIVVVGTEVVDIEVADTGAGHAPAPGAGMAVPVAEMPDTAAPGAGMAVSAAETTDTVGPGAGMVVPVAEKVDTAGPGTDRGDIEAPGTRVEDIPAADIGIGSFETGVDQPETDSTTALAEPGPAGLV